ncbi:hypothetical protein [Lacticaseibacillus brantae]|nr:hypothetical protein [Lacticaseibacillus brantae]
MLKVVDLPDGKQIALQSSAVTAILYKSQFGKDFFADMIKLSKVFGTVNTEKGVDLSDLSYEDLDRLDMTVLYQVTWAFAKNADDSIGDLQTWLAQFDTFPLQDIMTAVSDLIANLFTTTKNSKAPTKRASR